MKKEVNMQEFTENMETINLFYYKGWVFFQKVFIECTNPCNKSWMVKGKSPYYIQTLYEIDKLLRLTS